MGWAIAGLLAVLAFAAMAWALKMPRRAWEVSAAALVFGLAGYALQGQPGMVGAPKEAAQKIAGPAAAEAVKARKAMSGGSSMTDRYMTPADAMFRHGQYADAAEMLRGAVAEEPGNAEAWLAMANALVAHADGNLSPAAVLAFGRAQGAAPGHPGPPFFLGLALARTGRLEEGRAIWAELLANSPADAPWRAELFAQLANLDAFIARQKAAPRQ